MARSQKAPSQSKARVNPRRKASDRTNAKGIRKRKASDRSTVKVVQEQKASSRSKGLSTRQQKEPDGAPTNAPYIPNELWQMIAVSCAATFTDQELWFKLRPINRVCRQFVESLVTDASLRKKYLPGACDYQQPLATRRERHPHYEPGTQVWAPKPGICACAPSGAGQLRRRYYYSYYQNTWSSRPGELWCTWTHENDRHAQYQFYFTGFDEEQPHLAIYCLGMDSFSSEVAWRIFKENRYQQHISNGWKRARLGKAVRNPVNFVQRLYTCNCPECSPASSKVMYGWAKCESYVSPQTDMVFAKCRCAKCVRSSSKGPRVASGVPVEDLKVFPLSSDTAVAAYVDWRYLWTAKCLIEKQHEMRSEQDQNCQKKRKKARRG